MKTKGIIKRSYRKHIFDFKYEIYLEEENIRTFNYDMDFSFTLWGAKRILRRMIKENNNRGNIVYEENIE